VTSFTDQLLDHIRKHGSGRSRAMEEALGMPKGYATSLLGPYVKKGELVVCKVETPGKPPQNEYRFSVAGGAPVAFTPLRTPRPVGNAAPQGRTAAGSSQGRNDPEGDPAKRDGTPAATAPAVERVGAIEKGVPLPLSKRGNGELRATFTKLEIGDSFLTSYSSKACYGMAKTLGVKITYRPVPDSKQIRVDRARHHREPGARRPRRAHRREERHHRSTSSRARAPPLRQ
jgi:hypothetical protein